MEKQPHNPQISRERLTQSPTGAYVSEALEPSYHWMVRHYYSAVMRTHAAWAVVLAQTGLLSRSEAAGVARTCLRAEQDVPPHLQQFDPRVEYFYSAVEKHLTSIVGDAAGEINIARTRPEPLARLAMRDSLVDLLRALHVLRSRVLELADGHKDTLMLQWTHFQPAQPSTFGHYFEAIGAALSRDWARLWSALSAVNLSTLGSGALAGSSYDVDRVLAAELLGFDGVVENTLDAVAATDHMIDCGFAAASTMITVSRFSQDLWTWHTDEFALVEIGDEYSGSSSLMPQKKNPYPFEYARISAARVIGDFAAALVTAVKTNYQDTKDVEEGVAEETISAMDRTASALSLVSGTISTLRVASEHALIRAGSGFATATEIAAVLHRSHPALSYRAAHRVVGAAVARAVHDGRRVIDPADIEAAGLQLGISVSIDRDDLARASDARAFVLGHAGLGGPAPSEVNRLVVKAKARLRADEDLLTRFEERQATARALLRSRADALAG